MPANSFIQELVRTSLTNVPFIAVSNREPFIHNFLASGEIECGRATSGVVTALDPVLRATRGTWIALGSGSADFEVATPEGMISVPPENPAYMLKRIRLEQKLIDGYYNGFANQAIWPLCHLAHQQPVFDTNHWNCYKEVNSIFSDAVCSRLEGRAGLVFVQDYHFALLPKLIKRRCPQATVVHFWHIPWPVAEVFDICPWKREILEGLLASDVVGFHLPQYCNHFLESASYVLPHIERHGSDAIAPDGHRTNVYPFPVGVDFHGIEACARSTEVTGKIADLRAKYRLPRWVGVGIDRLDYIKGLPERIQAVARFLELFPEYRGAFSLVQVAVPSRTELPVYRELGEMVRSLAEEVNQRFGTPDWTPIVLICENLPPADVTALYCMADLCLVTSLQDGMNLVAKEFVAARTEDTGVLLLSRFAGASAALQQALLLNPYHTDEVAWLIRKALLMNPAEAAARMRRLRLEVRKNNVMEWISDILTVATMRDEDSAAAGKPRFAAQQHSVPPRPILSPRESYGAFPG